jgi:DNA-binding NarL/FixJ family response regulator
VALRTLIVDDNPRFIEAARRLLERQGMDVVGAASTSAQAVQQAERLRPEVILIDIELGPESGFDLARQLASADGSRPNMIMISTHGADEVADLVAVSPVLGFLPKSNLSAAAIRELLDDRATPPSVTNPATAPAWATEITTAVTVPIIAEGRSGEAWRSQRARARTSPRTQKRVSLRTRSSLRPRSRTSKRETRFAGSLTSSLRYAVPSQKARRPSNRRAQEAATKKCVGGRKWSMSCESAGTSPTA